MVSQRLIDQDENDEHISLWREYDGRFTIRDMWNAHSGAGGDCPDIQISPDLAEEIANAILKSILVNGR